jgi:NADPH2:quinone reductase
VTVKAIRGLQQGGPEVLRLVELPTPAPAAGEALVRVEACGVNFIDTYQRSGAYKIPLPATLGLEGGGVVESVGPGVDSVKPGSRVAWTNLPGSYATHAVLRAERLVPVPDGVSTRTAAAAMLQGLTAHYLTHSTHALRAGESCLIHAAAGGVGLLFCQIAKRAGARVIGTASGDKGKLARAAGADEVIDYTKADFEAEVKRLTGGRGVDVVYDSVGKDTLAKSIRCARPRGLVVLFGQSSGAVDPLEPQVLSQSGSLFFTRPTLAHYIASRDELLSRCNDLLGWIARKEVDVRIGAEFPLADARRAHEALEGRKTTGKVLLTP